MKRIAILILLASLLLAACGGGTQTVSGSFVGKVDGSDAFIAITLHTNGEVTAYVCDSATISAWFKGKADGSTLDLTNASGAHLTADLAPDSFTGTFTPSGANGGSALTFSVQQAGEPAGLYRADATLDGVAYVGGWIVLPSGEERGAISGGGKLLTTLTGMDRTSSRWVDPTTDP
jgi:hypothetical protein